MADAGKRLTMKDVAQASGVHYSTVSLALRNDPRLPKDTCQHVQAIAEKIGYRKDPLVSHLMQMRRNPKLSEFQGCLAIVSQFDSPHRYKKHHDSRLIFEGAQAQAKMRGYTLEHFWFNPSDTPIERFSKILRTRSISGMIILPNNEHHPELASFDFSPFTVVVTGHSRNLGHLDTVTADYYGAMNHAMRHLRQRGYKRIGFLPTDDSNIYTDFQWLAAYLRHTHKMKPTVPIAPLEVKPKLKPQGKYLELERWMRKEAPDALVTTLSSYEFIAQALPTLKIKIPEDIGLICMNLSEKYRKKGISGIEYNFEQIGAEAVNRVLTLMSVHQRGQPEVGKRIAVEAAWREGETLSKWQSDRVAE